MHPFAHLTLSTQRLLLRESCIVNGVLTDSARYGLLQREWLEKIP